jgi:O-antigen ligase
MFPWRLQTRALDGRELATGAAACAFTALAMIIAGHKLSPPLAALAPLGLAFVVLLLMRPLLSLCVTVGLVILIEGTFGLVPGQAGFYTELFHRLTVVDGLVALTIVSVALQLLRDGRALRLPRELRILDSVLVLGMVCGIAVGKGGSHGLISLVLAENVVAYLLLLPLAIANMRVEPSRLRLVLGSVFALAILKAGLGLLEVAAHKGLSVEGNANLTYYEPTANWVVMLALFAVVVAVLARLRPPLWMLLGTPLLLASLVLSYRRSFWIATVLGLLLVVLLALSPVGRRLLVPTALLVAAGVWLLGSIHFQSNSPIVKRATSLSPSSLTANVEDRYRLDERANVLADLEKKPITGIGILGDWQAGKRPLPVEHAGGREYVHFAALWWWMKMGILGLIAYVLLMFSTARLAWRVWRQSADAITCAFGLASLCGVAGLIVAETTATFTGAEQRFTVLFAAQVGLLALLSSQATGREREDVDPAGSADGGPETAPAPALRPATG